MMILLRLALVVSLLTAGAVAKQPVPRYRPLPTLREQNELEKQWVQKRWDYIPTILKKYDYDAWIITQREYAEDTIFRSLHPATTTFSARRRTLFMFHTHPNYTSPVHLVELKQSLWDELEVMLDRIDPKRIAVNIDEDMAFSDGLHTGEGHLLLSKLSPKYATRLSSRRELGVETIAHRSGGKSQLEMYNLMMENVWAMIVQGFSEEVVKVGETTAEDLEWWFRDVMRWRLGCGTWFPPSVTIYRSPLEKSVEEDPYMREGDMLHVDIGITSMNLNTDTQHLAYILRSNETSPPQGLLQGLKDANRLQDMVRDQMKPGKTGDEVLFDVFDDMRRERLEGRIYSHPIGDYGHSAGAVIGMQNNQHKIPGGGTNKVLKDYWTSVELSGTTYVPEWGVDGTFPLEEDVHWDEATQSFEWVYAQQTEFHLIKPSSTFSLCPPSSSTSSWSLGNKQSSEQGTFEAETRSWFGVICGMFGLRVVRWA